MAKMFSVYDSKAKIWLNPFVMRSKGEALRAWQTTVNQEDTMMCKFPEDFCLYEVGEFDESSGTIKVHEVRETLGLACEFKRIPPPQEDLFNPVPNLSRVAASAEKVSR